MNPDGISTGPGGTITRLLALAIPGTARDRLGDWVIIAACAAADPELFFPVTDNSDAEAKRLCAQCLVRTHCLEYSLATGPHWGVWGGLNEAERNSLARRRKRQRRRTRSDITPAPGGVA